MPNEEILGKLKALVEKSVDAKRQVEAYLDGLTISGKPLTEAQRLDILNQLAGTFRPPANMAFGSDNSAQIALINELKKPTPKK